MTINLTTALVSFVRMGDVKLFQFSSTVIASVSGNRLLPDADRYVSAVKEAFNIYGAALDLAKNGGAAQKADKNAKRQVLVAALKELCGYCNLVAQGSRVILSTTGFELSKEGRTPAVLSPLDDVLVTYGKNIGDLVVTVKKEKVAKTINFMHTLDQVIGPNTVWKVQSMSSKTCIISGLPAGATVTIRVVAVGSRKQTVTSHDITRVVR